MGWIDAVLVGIVVVLGLAWSVLHLDPRRDLNAGSDRPLLRALDWALGLALAVWGFRIVRYGQLDFALVLVLATLISGVVWGLDRARLARQRRALFGEEAPEPALVDYCRSFFPLLLVVLVLRSFVAEPFRIPSGSMIPTLLDGDFILVNKYSYGVRLPVLETVVYETGSPQRGDVAVFRYPRDERQRFIKRVVGLPGDRIAYRGIQLYVNGEPVPMERAGVYTGPQAAGATLFRETVGEVEHLLIHKDGPDVRRFQQGDFVVPEGHYYVMGDNRDSSNDSRAWGLVPEENLVGRAFMIWMNWEKLTVAPRWERIGQSIE